MELEEKYLRDELNSRINLMYSHSNNIATFTITIFTAVISAFSAFFKEITTAGVAFPIFLLLPSVFLLLSFFIHFSAQKFKENLNQIIELAAYFIVIYSDPVFSLNDLKTKNSWEFSTFEAQSQNLTGYYNQNIRGKINKEYSLLSLVPAISVVALLVFAIITLIEGERNFNIIVWSIFFLIEYFIILFLIIKNCISVHYNTTTKQFFKQKKECVISWCAYYRKNGALTDESITTKFGEGFVKNIDDAIKEQKPATKKNKFKSI